MSKELIGAECIRPWGNYRILHIDRNCKIKILTVDIGQKLSLQYHNHRSEYWTVINGAGVATKDKIKIHIVIGSHVVIPCGTIHRIENTGCVPLEILELQKGEYLEEDDIVRVEDDYGRVIV